MTAAAAEGGAELGGGAGPAVAVVMSRFPKHTETFVVNEILGLRRQGLRVEILPLLPRQRGPVQPLARPLVDQARYGPIVGREPLRALARRVAGQPRTLAGIVGRLAADTWRHPTTLVKDLVLLPRVCVLADELDRLGVEHVHAHFLTHGGFAAWALGRLTGRPWSVVAHGSDVHRRQAMMATKVAEASFVAAVSAFNRRVILDVCRRPDLSERVLVVRCGVDLDRLTPRDGALADGPLPDGPLPDGQPFDGAAPLVVCVGTLHEVKGQRYLLAALASLNRRGRRVDAVLAGDGPDRRMLEELARELGVAEQVTFTGSLAHDRVVDLYRRAAVVVTPSVVSSDGRREGIPTVLLEAMACGVPVVASDLTGIPELVEHRVTGLLTPPGDPEAIARAVETLLDDPALAADLVARAAERVRAEYDLAATSARLAGLLTGRPALQPEPVPQPEIQPERASNR